MKLAILLLTISLLGCDRNGVKNPNAKSIELQEQAAIAIIGNNYDPQKVLSILDESLYYNKKNAAALALKAQILVKLNKLEEAKFVISQAQMILPNVAEFHVFRSLIEMKLYPDVKPIVHFAKAVRIYTEKIKSGQNLQYANRATVYALMDQDDLARSDLRNIITENKNHVLVSILKNLLAEKSLDKRVDMVWKVSLL